MASQQSFYRRISLELNHSWPGEVYLRLEPHDKGPAIMLRVMPADIVAISQLANEQGATVVEQAEPQYDDDFQPGDS